MFDWMFLCPIRGSFFEVLADGNHNLVEVALVYLNGFPAASLHYAKILTSWGLYNEAMCTFQSLVDGTAVLRIGWDNLYIEVRIFLTFEEDGRRARLTPHSWLSRNEEERFLKL